MQYATPHHMGICSGFYVEPSAVDNEGLGDRNDQGFQKESTVINMKGLYLHSYHQELQVQCTVENWWKMASKVNTGSFTRM